MTKKQVVDLIKLKLNDTRAELASTPYEGTFHRLSAVEEELTSILSDIKTQELKEMFYRGLSPRETLIAQNMETLYGLQFSDKKAICDLKNEVVVRAYEFNFPSRTLEDYYRFFDRYGVATYVLDGMVF